VSTDQNTPDDGLATVHYLPKHQADTTPAAIDAGVIEGELVSDEEYALLTSQKAQAIERYRGYRRDVVTVYKGVKTVATHDYTKVAAKTVARHVLYVPAGAGVVAKRLWEAKTNSRYERQMRAAEAAGNFERLDDWESRSELARERRHKRRMDWITAPFQLAKALAAATVTLVGVLVGLGIVLAAANKDISAFLDPFTAVLSLVKWVSIAVAVAWGPLVLATPWVVVLWLWNEGRKRATLPGWFHAKTSDETGDVVPDERAISKALQHMGIGPLNKAFKDGWQPTFVSPTGRDGNGWLSQVRLPLGVTVEMIADRKNVLAHNLTRLPIEVWPVEPKSLPGVLEVWVADQGSLSGPAPAWPLLEEGTTDFFQGVPFGVSQRGAELTGKLWGCNYMFGGIMGQGKSAATRTIALGAALDPLVELSAYVFAYNADFDPFKPRLTEYVKGDDDEQIEAALEALRRLRSDVSERGKLLETYSAEKVSRAMAEKDRRLRPKVAIFDEVHELFEHPKHGKEAAELAVKVMKKARKTAITLIFTTVSPTATSIPKEITRNTSHRVAFAVGDHIANDGILGSGRHKAGVRATSLVPGEDRGTAMTVGFSAKPFELARTYYVALEKENNVDQVTPVIERAMAAIEAAGDSVTPTEPTTEQAGPDLLADIAAVFRGASRLRTQEVLQRLTERDRATYGGWTFTDLHNALPPEAKPYKSGGVMQVSAKRIQEGIAERDRGEDDETADFDGDV
jgi:S-DNA-T family DNA segregation ATPase FtsK/SpoIIIE